jgi:hypothetical protein
VELLVNKPGEDCVTKLRLVEGELEYRVKKTGKLVELKDPNRNNVVCIDASGNVTYSTSTQSILSFSADSAPPPPGFIPGGSTSPIAPPPVMSPTQPL